MSSDSWYDSGVNFVGGLLEKGMEGYIEVEKAKASNPANQAASQDATFNSPTIDENPTAKNGQTVATTANGAALGGLGKLAENPATLYVAGGVALLGLVLLLKR